MKLAYIGTGDDGESHLSEIELPLDASQRRATSAPIPATQFAFGISEALTPQGWHHAPRRQLVAVLSGVLEIEVGGGTKARFGAGDTFVADDLSGRGHLTRDVEGPVRLLYVHLPAEMNLGAWSSAG
jgi:hypothetical protein